MPPRLPEFSDPFTLIEHARKHIRNAQIQLEQFFAGKPYSMVVDRSFPDWESHRIRLDKPIPSLVTLTVMDAVASLRSSLDQAVYSSAVCLSGGTPDGTGFPFASTESDLDQRLAGAKRNSVAPIEIHSVIRRYAPYAEKPNRLLSALNKVRNSNLHRLLVPAAVVAQHTGIDVNRLKVSGTVSGTTGIGSRGRWIAEKRELEYLCGPSPIEFDGEPHFSFTAHLDTIEDIRQHEVIDVLTQILQEVEVVVSAIEWKTAEVLYARGRGGSRR